MAETLKSQLVATLPTASIRQTHIYAEFEAGRKDRDE